MRLERALKDAVKMSLAACALACGWAPLSAQDAQAPAPGEDAGPVENPEPAKAPTPVANPEALAAAKVIQASLDAWRARNFEGWISKYHPEVIVYAPQMRIVGRKELRAIYRAVFDMRIPDPDILESGWTGERVFVRQQEYFGKGVPGAVTYAEYEVVGGLITTVYAQQL